MLTSIMVNGSIAEAAGGEASAAKPQKERSEASRADSRRRQEFDCALAFEAVTKREPCRRCGTSPNSRLSRRKRTTRPASSHLQEWDKPMEQKQIFIGIDVAKVTFQAASCPQAVNLSLPNNKEGIHQLTEAVQSYSVELVVLEATAATNVLSPQSCSRQASRLLSLLQNRFAISPAASASGQKRIK